MSKNEVDAFIKNRQSDLKKNLLVLMMSFVIFFVLSLVVYLTYNLTYNESGDSAGRVVLPIDMVNQ